MKNIARRYWDIIAMPDKVIDRVNILGKYQQELLVFSYCKVRLIAYGDVEITVVDGGGYENYSPLKIENENDLGYQEVKRRSIPIRRTKPLNKPSNLNCISYNKYSLE